VNNPILFESGSKKYYSIGEVSKITEVEPNILRYWEKKFSKLKPDKRRGNRRNYQLSDIQLIKKIKELLHVENYTLAGAIEIIEGNKQKSELLNRSEKIDQIIDRLRTLQQKL